MQHSKFLIPNPARRPLYLHHANVVHEFEMLRNDCAPKPNITRRIDLGRRKREAINQPAKTTAADKTDCL